MVALPRRLTAFRFVAADRPHTLSKAKARAAYDVAYVGDRVG